MNGRSRGIRTHDPVIKSHLLYQLSYAPIHVVLTSRWSELRDSNPRQPPWQGGTLPTELSSLGVVKTATSISNFRTWGKGGNENFSFFSKSPPQGLSRLCGSA